jgi:hypothetical protein
MAFDSSTFANANPVSDCQITGGSTVMVTSGKVFYTVASRASASWYVVVRFIWTVAP